MKTLVKRVIAFALMGLFFAVMVRVVHAEHYCGFRPLPPPGCYVVCVCSDEAERNCDWQIVCPGE